MQATVFDIQFHFRQHNCLEILNFWEIGSPDNKNIWFGWEREVKHACCTGNIFTGHLRMIRLMARVGGDSSSLSEYSAAQLYKRARSIM